MTDGKNPVLEVVPPACRLQGGLPKIGIRPTIDGRRGGVRECLEGQTMGMARAAAKLIRGNLRHPNGQPVECVIADTCIGGVAEAAGAEKFAREGVGVSLTVTPCWCYGSETMDMDPLTLKAVWGFNGTERPGAVYLAAVLAAHNQKGLPAFGIYGRDVQDRKRHRASPPTSRRRSCASPAPASPPPGCAASPTSPSAASRWASPAPSSTRDFFQDYLGMRNESVDMSEFTRRIEEKIYDPRPSSSAPSPG